MKRLLPFSAVLVALALLLTPSQGVVYEPFKDAADKLRQAIYDRFFFTEPRNIFTLASQGYYPKGPSQLGGPAEPSDEPVMQVAAPRKVYLRGTLCNSLFHFRKLLININFKYRNHIRKIRKTRTNARRICYSTIQ